jgi:dihydroorotase
MTSPAEPSPLEAPSAGDTPSLVIARPDDWHVHLRDDEMLAAVVGWSARRYRYVLVMPNLRPPVTTVAAARAYRDRILACAPDEPAAAAFTPMMTLFASPDIDLDDLRRGVEEGVLIGVKYYPAGATTNADQARGTLAELGDLLECLCDIDLRLLVHAESTDPTVDIFDREAAFLERDLAPVCERFPELAVTVEHVSTRAGVDFVAAHPQSVATITPHHLARERSDMLAHGMRPDLYCKPVINTADDRAALVVAAISGDPSYFCGTDSAPHPTTAKYGPKAAAGIFNAPYGLEVVAEVFHRAGALDRLDGFVSGHGAAVYGVEPSPERIRLTRLDEPVAADERAEVLVTSKGDEVVLFGVDEARRWQIDPA